MEPEEDVVSSVAMDFDNLQMVSQGHIAPTPFGAGGDFALDDS